MRERDLDLIAALVEGRLEDETEARALIANSVEHQTEYEAQKLAFETLSSLGPAKLNENERAALHRDLWTELRAEGQTTPSRTRTPWYYRWAPVAAGMFVVVGLVAVINQGGSGGDAALEAGSATTNAAASDGADSPDSGGETAESPTEDGTSTITDLLSGDFSRALSDADVQFYDAEADKVRDGELEGVDSQSFDEEAPQSGRLEACLDTAGLEGFRVVEASSPSEDEDDSSVEAPEDAPVYITAIPEDTDVSEYPVVFVDAFSCEVIYVDQ